MNSGGNIGPHLPFFLLPPLPVLLWALTLGMVAGLSATSVSDRPRLSHPEINRKPMTATDLWKGRHVVHRSYFQAWKIGKGKGVREGRGRRQNRPARLAESARRVSLGVVEAQRDCESRRRKSKKEHPSSQSLRHDADTYFDRLWRGNRKCCYDALSRRVNS